MDVFFNFPDYLEKIEIFCMAMKYKFVIKATLIDKIIILNQWTYKNLLKFNNNFQPCKKIFKFKSFSFSGKS